MKRALLAGLATSLVLASSAGAFAKSHSHHTAPHLTAAQQERVDQIESGLSAEAAASVGAIGR